MAGALVAQTNGNVAPTLNTTVTLPGTMGNVGDLLVAFIGRSGGTATGALTGVTDSAGNTWTLATRGAVAGGSNTRVECWYVANLATAITTVTFQSSTSQFYTWDISEWSGMGLGVLDVASPDNSYTSGTATIVTPAITTTADNDLVLGCMHGSHKTTCTLTQAGSLPTSGWTELNTFDYGSTTSDRAAYQFCSAGSRKVEWVNNVSGGFGTITVAFTVAPEITSINVNHGSAAGGTTVIITGKNFTGATAVWQGFPAGASYVVNSDTQITATTAAHAAGAVSLLVTTPAGNSNTITYTFDPSGVPGTVANTVGSFTGTAAGTVRCPATGTLGIGVTGTASGTKYYGPLPSSVFSGIQGQGFMGGRIQGNAALPPSTTFPGTAALAASFTSAATGTWIAPLTIIQAAGFPVYTENNGAEIDSVAVTWQQVGDLAVVAQLDTGAVPIASVSSPKTAGWSQTYTGTTDGIGSRWVVWTGVVTATGADTLALTYGSAASYYGVVVTELTVGTASVAWGVAAAGATLNAVASVPGPVSFPSRSSTAAVSQAYLGFLGDSTAGTSFSPLAAGFTYSFPTYVYFPVAVAFRGALAPSTPYQPTVNFGSGSGVNFESAALIFSAVAAAPTSYASGTQGTSFTGTAAAGSLKLAGTGARVTSVTGTATGSWSLIFPATAAQVISVTGTATGTVVLAATGSLLATVTTSGSGSMHAVGTGSLVTSVTSVATARWIPPNTITALGSSLMFNGFPYHVLGLNSYPLAQGYTRAQLDAFFAELPPFCLTRFWCGQLWGTVGGSTNWTALDDLFASAAAHNQLLLPALSIYGQPGEDAGQTSASVPWVSGNAYSAGTWVLYSGPDGWHDNYYALHAVTSAVAPPNDPTNWSPYSAHWQFYNPAGGLAGTTGYNAPIPGQLAPLSLKAWITACVNRYKSSPALGMWEIMSEPECDTNSYVLTGSPSIGTNVNTWTAGSPGTLWVASAQFIPPGSSSGTLYFGGGGYTGITYTGVTANSIMGCVGGTGVITAGSVFVPEAPAATALRAFFDNLGGLIHSLDPNHLVESGLLGGGQEGMQGADYTYINQSPGIDVSGMHDYSGANPLETTVSADLSAMLAIGKPFLEGEVGIGVITDPTGNTPVADTTVRAADFVAKYNAQVAAGGSGFLIWCALIQQGGTGLDVGLDDPVYADLVGATAALKTVSVVGTAVGTHIDPIPSMLAYDDMLALLGPVGWWKLSDALSSTSIVDSSGNGLTGTVHGGVTFQRTGPITGTPADKVALFDGSTGYIQIPVMGAFPSKGTAVFWMHPSRVASWDNPFATSLDYNNCLRFEENTGGSFGFNISGSYGAELTPSETVGVWYMVTVTWDQTISTVKGYLNDIGVTSSAAVAAWPSGTVAPVIGQGFDGTRFFQGDLGEVAFFNTVLTPSQIGALYTARTTTALTASASASFTGTAGGTRGALGTASLAAGLTATAAGTVLDVGTGTATAALLTSATGQVHDPATAGLAVALTTAATGTVRSTGTGALVATLTTTSTASVTDLGTAVGLSTVITVVTGSVTTQGTGPLSLAFVGTATAVVREAATATLASTVVGSATATNVDWTTAVAPVAFVGTAAGAVLAPATAALAAAIMSTALGLDVVPGAGTQATALTTTVLGTLVFPATVASTSSFTGVAAGVVVPVFQGAATTVPFLAASATGAVLVPATGPLATTTLGTAAGSVRSTATAATGAALSTTAVGATFDPGTAALTSALTGTAAGTQGYPASGALSTALATSGAATVSVPATAAEVIGLVGTATATVRTAGTGTLPGTLTTLATGVSIDSGTSALATGFTGLATGSVVLAGTGALAVSLTTQASGSVGGISQGTGPLSVAFVGTASATSTRPATATLLAALTGSAGGAYGATAAPSVGFLGTASGTVAYPATAAATSALAGTGAASVRTPATAAQAAAFTATATGLIVYLASASLAPTLTSSATATVRFLPTAAGFGSLIGTASASPVRVPATAAAAVALSATATSVASTAASASAPTAFVATAAGKVVCQGSATLVVAFADLATAGAVIYPATAAATGLVIGTAAGVMTRYGAAAVVGVFLGQAVGQAVIFGSGELDSVITTEATGKGLGYASAGETSLSMVVQPAMVEVPLYEAMTVEPALAGTDQSMPMTVQPSLN